MRAEYSFRGHHIVAEGDTLAAVADEIGRKIGAVLLLDGDVYRAVAVEAPSRTCVCTCDTPAGARCAYDALRRARRS